jgi:hypothetical protein
MKVFRDLIYITGGWMREDHRFYKRQGLYDFAQKQLARRLQFQLLGLAMTSKKARSRASKAMRDVLLKQYDTIIARY